MAWPDKLKLKKGLISSLTNAGYTSPKEIQQKTLARIGGGQDVIAIGPEGCGKTTTYIMAMLSRFTYAADGITRVLILVPDREHVESVISQIEQLNNNKTISIVGLYATTGTEAQMDAMAEGADIVVATPDRARAIYLKLGLNLNKIELLILDDADLIVKQGLQLPVAELANGIIKCQHLVFTEVMHDKLERMIAPFMKQPALIEVEEAGEVQLETLQQLLYHVPNFGTKVNLLNLFMQDDEVFTKAVVFVNTRPTAEKVYESLRRSIKDAAAVYNPWFFEMEGFKSVDDFMSSDQTRVLVVTNDELPVTDLQGIPFLIHFELPADKETYIERVTPQAADEDVLALTFVTDLELGAIKKIEQTIGNKIPVDELPAELLIEKSKSSADKKQPSNNKEPESTVGAAFHQKKASNAKTYNLSAGEKAKMSKKKKH